MSPRVRRTASRRRAVLVAAAEAFPRMPTRAEEAVRLRSAHALDTRIEIEQLAVQETIRALTRQVERAARRLEAVAVVDDEHATHADAALRLGAAHRRLLELAAARRRAREEIAVRTYRLRRAARA